MKPDLESFGEEDDPDVVAAIDEIDGRQHLVIADITRDDVWMTVPEAEALSADEWR
ncbi:hypothetical protein ACFO5R_11540 [Halosolutus amylolyticus]|uniref:Uncharacterized protein n=1 Tax=Halosolutus amylolyticus TaxID=2932267 RepID=A0ABD5PRI7_9EURY|nr:hypothetical protein [Halosolutus amylolyticus]